MDQTPSLRRALMGLALVIAAIVGGYVYLQTASDDAVRDDAKSPPATVQFVRSGGFTGSSNWLELQRDGTGILRGDDVEKKKIIVNVGRNKGVEIFRLLDDVWPTTNQVINDSAGCADCTQYDITYNNVRVSIYQIATRFHPVTNELDRIMDDYLKL